MVFTDQQHILDQLPLVIMTCERVERATHFKCIGTIVDIYLGFSENCDVIYKKCMQRLHLLKKLWEFEVNKEIVKMTCKSLIESILCFNMTIWFGNLSSKERVKLTRVVNMGSKLTGMAQTQPSKLFETCI